MEQYKPQWKPRPEKPKEDLPQPHPIIKDEEVIFFQQHPNGTTTKHSANYIPSKRLAELLEQRDIQQLHTCRDLTKIPQQDWDKHTHHNFTPFQSTHTHKPDHTWTSRGNNNKDSVYTNSFANPTYTDRHTPPHSVWNHPKDTQTHHPRHYSPARQSSYQQHCRTPPRSKPTHNRQLHLLVRLNVCK